MIHTFHHQFTTGATATARCGFDSVGQVHFSVEWQSKAAGREIVREHLDEYRQWRTEIFGRVFPGKKALVVEV